VLCIIVRPYTAQVIDNYPLMQPRNGKIQSVYDLNSDGKVDMRDIAAAAKAFGTVSGDSTWNPACDVNPDLRVDMTDIALISHNFG
jgi:hypothetical protein